MPTKRPSIKFEAILIKTMEDPDFRKRLIANPLETLERECVKVTPEMRDIIKKIDWDCVDSVADAVRVFGRITC
jgi:hypothetical protein